MDFEHIKNPALSPAPVAPDACSSPRPSRVAAQLCWRASEQGMVLTFFTTNDMKIVGLDLCVVAYILNTKLDKERGSIPHATLKAIRDYFMGKANRICKVISLEEVMDNDNWYDDPKKPRVLCSNYKIKVSKVIRQDLGR
ncbi:hypothetical protein AHAS_Ahas13G0227100 [Arachis hypogaea]